MHKAVRRLFAIARRGMGGSTAGLLPLFIGSVLVAVAVVAASQPVGDWSFQSPVSPIIPVSPVTPTPESPTAVPEETVVGPGLVSVPAAPDFVPWLVGIVLVAAVVVAATLWSRRRGKGEGST